MEASSSLSTVGAVLSVVFLGVQLFVIIVASSLSFVLGMLLLLFGVGVGVYVVSLQAKLDVLLRVFPAAPRSQAL